jgi:hypothetical protein
VRLPVTVRLSPSASPQPTRGVSCTQGLGEADGDPSEPHRRAS